jgi:hypothetical protein
MFAFWAGFWRKRRRQSLIAKVSEFLFFLKVVNIEKNIMALNIFDNLNNFLVEVWFENLELLKLFLPHSNCRQHSQSINDLLPFFHGGFAFGKISYRQFASSYKESSKNCIIEWTRIWIDDWEKWYELYMICAKHLS